MKILCLSPHTDDSEFGAGGTIAKLIDKGHDIYYVAFSACKQSVLKDFPEDVLIKEVQQATNQLGIKELRLFDYQVRTFDKYRQEILDKMIILRDEINPDYVFIPSKNDIHQDHSVIHNEAVRCFKHSSILAYEMPWNNLSFNTTCFYSLTEGQLERKIKALFKYKSQYHRPYTNREFIESLARVRGVQAGVKYAETFEVIRLIQ